MKARQIAQQLHENGFPILSVQEPTEALDGIIQITPHLQVQVSLLDDFMGIVEVTENGSLDFGDMYESMTSLMEDLRKSVPQ